MTDPSDYRMSNSAPEPPSPESKRSSRMDPSSGYALDTGLPANISAEKMILGAILLENQSFVEVDEVLTPEDFSLDSHQRIYHRMSTLFSTGHAVDLVTLANELARFKEMDSVGGVAYLSSLTEGLPRRPVIEEYLRIVKDRSLLRQLMLISSAAIARAADQSDPAISIGLDLSSQIQDAITSGLSNTLERAGEFLNKTFPTARAMTQKTAKSKGLETGFEEFDEMTCGLQKGELAIVGARPSLGKTAWACKVVEHATLNYDAKVAFFSLEMNKESLLARMICSRARVPFQDYKKGVMTETMLDEYESVYEEFCNSNLYIDDEPKTAKRIAAQSRALKAKSGLDLIVIDYLGYMQHEETKRQVTTHQLIGADALLLKMLAKELGVPVLLLAQLSRDLTKRTDKRPVLSDLRDCLAAGAMVDTAFGRRRIEEIAADTATCSAVSIDSGNRCCISSGASAWSVGEKEIFTVTTRLGRKLSCTSGQRLLTPLGWKSLGELKQGSSIGTIRKIPEPSICPSVDPDFALILGWMLGDGCFYGTPAITIASTEEVKFAVDLAKRKYNLIPTVKPESNNAKAWKVILGTGSMTGAKKNPLTRKIREMGVWKSSGQNKFIPEAVWGWSNEAVAALLRGLLHADGSFSLNRQGSPSVRFSNISERLARGVQSLLLRFSIVSSLGVSKGLHGGYGKTKCPIWTVRVGECKNVQSYLTSIGFLMSKHRRAVERLKLTKRTCGGSVDLLPLEFTEYASARKSQLGLTHKSLGYTLQGKRMDRLNALKIGVKMNDSVLIRAATDDVLWDTIASVESDGIHQTYDMSVPGANNFSADGFITHNSGNLEEHADLVAFLHREGYYDPKDESLKNKGEIIIAKQRQGPTGTCHVAWDGNIMRWSDKIDPKDFSASAGAWWMR